MNNKELEKSRTSC